MSTPPDKSVQLPAGDVEPVASRSSHAVWPFVLLGVAMFAGLLYVDARGGGFDNQVYAPFHSLEEVTEKQPKSAGDEVYNKGRKVYVTYCQVCHQANGMGAPGQFPPLVRSDWVLAEHPNRIIRLVLNGGQGPIPINGEMFNTSSAMLPWKDTLTDEDIAAVLTYVRRQKEWKNNASIVTPDQVKAIRAKVADRSEPWTAPELLAIPLGPE